MEKEKFKRSLYAVAETSGKASKKCVEFALILYFLGVACMFSLDMIERNELKNRIKNNQRK